MRHARQRLQHLPRILGRPRLTENLRPNQDRRIRSDHNRRPDRSRRNQLGLRIGKPLHHHFGHFTRNRRLINRRRHHRERIPGVMQNLRPPRRSRRQYKFACHNEPSLHQPPHRNSCANGQEPAFRVSHKVNRGCHPERSEGSQKSAGRKTIRDVVELQHDGFLVFAELRAERVGDFADGGVGFDGGENRRDEVFAGAGAAG